MLEQIRLHAVADLRFYLRSRLLLGVGLAVLGIWGLGLVPMFLMDSSGIRFEQLKMLANQMHSLAWLSAAGIGLFAVSAHLRNHSTRLVFTRPAARETWLASLFLSAFLVAFVLHLAAAVVTAILSFAWAVPWQAGFLYLTIRSVFTTLIVVSLLIALGSSVHPLIAALVAGFLNDRLLLWLDTWLRAATAAGRSTWWERGLEWLVRGVYHVVPSLDPFSARAAGMTESMRVGRADWAYLGATAGYAILASAVFFLWAAFAIRRKRQI